MRREEHVDYHLVEDRHLDVHRRLESWARWVRVRPHGWQVAPMFRFYRPDNWDRVEATTVRADTAPRVSVNVPEAIDMEKAVSALPEKHRDAIRWCYYWSALHPLEARAKGVPHNPIGAARRLGVTKQGLLDLIGQGRTMLVNRRA